MFRDIKFPKTAKLLDNTELTCVERLESIMPLAVARPFVEEFITDSMKTKVYITRLLSSCILCTFLQVGGVAEQIKNAFKQRISEKDWLDEITKNRSKEKVKMTAAVCVCVCVCVCVYVCIPLELIIQF